MYVFLPDGPTPTEWMSLDRDEGRAVSRALMHMNSWFPGRINTIIDGGANVGHNSEAYALVNRDATVYALEPYEVAFEELEKTAKRVPTIKPFNLALSNVSGSAQFHIGESWTGGRIDPEGELHVTTIMGREFCKEHSIERVNFLKLDLEGHELHALDGFDLDMVDFVQVEAGVNRHQSQMLSYQTLYEYLTARGFWVFGFYDQIWEFKQGAFVGRLQFENNISVNYEDGAPIIRRMDVVFINNDLVNLRSI